MTNSHFKKYWSFYWPLAVTGSVLLLASQFQNGALGRYPNAARELATFAYASSLFQFLHATLVFIPQMVNVLARSARGLKATFRFILITAGLLTLPLVFFAFTPPGRLVVAGVYDLEGPVLEAVIRYLKFLTPMLLVNGLRHYMNGLLIQTKKTGIVTILNVIYLSGIIIMLVVGYHAGWQPVITLAAAQVSSGCFHLILSSLCRFRYYRLPKGNEDEAMTLKEVFDFFWPVAATSAQFSLSRPIIYSFISRMPNPEPMVAALRVAFDFAMMFHNPINQFRHLFVTFGHQEAARVRRFMIQIMLAVVGIMALTALTPLASLVFGTLLGVRPDIQGMARHVLLVMCLIPVVVTWRNYFHGLAMVRRATGSMAIGGSSRTVATFVLAWGFYSLGWLNHVTGAVVLVLGFVAETAAVMKTAPSENAEVLDEEV